MEIASLITGPVGVNTYIVYGKNAGECIIIDPSDTELVNKKLDELGVFLLEGIRLEQIGIDQLLIAKYGAGKGHCHAQDAGTQKSDKTVLTLHKGPPGK